MVVTLGLCGSRSRRRSLSQEAYQAVSFNVHTGYMNCNLPAGLAAFWWHLVDRIDDLFKMWIQKYAEWG